MSERSYVIRLYRRGQHPGPARRAHDAVALTGVVEAPESGERTAFHDIEELWAILARAGATPPAAPGRKQRR